MKRLFLLRKEFFYFFFIFDFHKILLFMKLVSIENFDFTVYAVAMT